MNPLSTEDFIAWVDRLAKLPQPLTLDAFRGTAIGFGWSPTDRSWEFVVDLTSEPWRMVSFEGGSGGIHNMPFLLIRPPGESAEDATQLNELFVPYETIGTQTQGKPFYTDSSESPTVAW